MGFTDEEFDRLESEIWAIFLPSALGREEDSTAGQRIDRILERLQDTPVQEGQPPRENGEGVNGES